jgi:hypothetical protein
MASPHGTSLLSFGEARRMAREHAPRLPGEPRREYLRRVSVLAVRLRTAATRASSVRAAAVPTPAPVGLIDWLKLASEMWGRTLTKAEVNNIRAIIAVAHPGHQPGSAPTPRCSNT